ncbi:MAG: hypothetical protein RBT45_06480, partial [Acholeplasmataceae bacterium]|nr:hypothetical protein [Acholeplasmataceae bacterium]
LIKDKGLSLLGYRYEITYQFNEETAPEYPLFIAVHHKFNSSKAQEGDLILVFARFGTKYYNIEEVYDVDIENNQIESTFDGATTNIYDLDDIEAVYVRRANQIETLYYIFGTIRGYIMLIIGNLVVFGGVYTFYIQPNPILKKKNKKEITDEKNEE